MISLLFAKTILSLRNLEYFVAKIEYILYTFQICGIIESVAWFIAAALIDSLKISSESESLHSLAEYTSYSFTVLDCSGFGILYKK